MMIKCEICKKLLKYITASHLKKHGITVEEYKKKYNVKHLQCKIMRRATSKRNKGNDWGRGKNLGNNYGAGERSEEFKEGARIRALGNKRAKGHVVSEERKEIMRGEQYALGYKCTEENKEKSRIRMNKMLADGTIISGGGRCKMYPVMNYTLGKEVKVQGKLELRFVKILNKLRIGWIIPKYKTYILNGKKKKYFCDFWLRDSRYYIEVKSRYYYNEHKEEVKAKKRMMIEKGGRKGFRYKIMFEKNIKGFEMNVADVKRNIN